MTFRILGLMLVASLAACGQKSPASLDAGASDQLGYCVTYLMLADGLGPAEKTLGAELSNLKIEYEKTAFENGVKRAIGVVDEEKQLGQAQRSAASNVESCKYLLQNISGKR